VEGPAHAHDQPGGEQLDEQLLAGRHAHQVVHHADHEHQHDAEGERRELLARDDLAPHRPAHHRAEAAGEGDAEHHRDAAQARDRARVAPARAGPLDRAERHRQAHQRRHHDAGDHARHQRRGAEQDRQIGSGQRHA